MTDIAKRPIPVPDEVSRPFWEGAKAGELRVQRCADCERLNHPASIACPACGGERLSFTALSGRARLHSWTVLHDAPAPGFAPLLPLVLGVVELEEQAGLLMSANIPGSAAGDLRIDMPLVAVFEPLDDAISLVQFRREGER